MTYFNYRVNYGPEHYEKIIADPKAVGKSTSKESKWLTAYRKAPTGGYNYLHINLDKAESLERLEKISKQEYQRLTDSLEE